MSGVRLAIPAGFEPATHGVEIRSVLNEINGLDVPCRIGVASGEKAVTYFHFCMELDASFANLVGANFGPPPCLQDIRERPMRGITIEEKWRQQSEATKSEAAKLPHGRARDALTRKARQLETASQINQWLSSPELKPPQ
jgi:hypothetical protein